MYSVSDPPLRNITTIPSTLSLVNGPRETAETLSIDRTVSAAQLHRELSQIRRIQKTLASREAHPPPPGWKTAMAQASISVGQLEQLLTYFKAQPSMPAGSQESNSYLAQLSSDHAKQQSGRTPGVPPSEVESPTVPPHIDETMRADPAVESNLARLLHLAEKAAEASSALESVPRSEVAQTELLSSPAAPFPTAQHENNRVTENPPLMQQIVLRRAEGVDALKQSDHQRALKGLSALAETAAARRQADTP